MVIPAASPLMHGAAYLKVEYGRHAMSKNDDRQKRANQLENLLRVAGSHGEEGIEKIAAQELNEAAKQDEWKRRQAEWAASGTGKPNRIKAEVLDGGTPKSIPAMDLNYQTKADRLAQQQIKFANRESSQPNRIAAVSLDDDTPAPRIQATELGASSIMERFAEKIFSPLQINKMFGDPVAPAVGFTAPEPQPRQGFKAFIMSTPIAEEIMRLMGREAAPAPEAPKALGLAGQMSALLEQSNSFKSTMNKNDPGRVVVVPINADGTPAADAARTMSHDQFRIFEDGLAARGGRLEKSTVDQSWASTEITHGGFPRSDIDGEPYTRTIRNGIVVDQNWKVGREGSGVAPGLIHTEGLTKEQIDQYDISKGIHVTSPAMQNRPSSLQHFKLHKMLSGAGSMNINLIEPPFESAEPHYEVTVKHAPNSKGYEHPEVRLGIYPEALAMDLLDTMKKTGVPTSVNNVAQTVELDDQERDLIVGYNS